MTKNRKIVAVVQARMGSKRLPGKVMRLIAGKPLIMYPFERLSKSKYIETVGLATSINPKDDELAEYFKINQIPCFRGSEDDIVARLYGAAKAFNAGALVRIWGDGPLIDPFVVDRLIGEYLASGVDYATNSKPPTFPFGMTAEIYSFKTLEILYSETEDPFYREFPREYIIGNRKFKMINVSYKKDVSNIRLTVDYEEDAKNIESIIKHFLSTGKIMNLENLISFYEKNKKTFDSASALPRNIEYNEKAAKRAEK